MHTEEKVSGVDSLVSFENSQGKKGRGTLIHITRTGVVFEVYNPYSIVQLSEVLPYLSIVRGNRTIYKGRAVVSQILTTGLMVIVSMTLIDPWSDLLGLRPGGELKMETERFISDWISSNRIQPDYQLAVSQMRNFLGEVSRWLDEAQVGNQVNLRSAQSEELLSGYYEEVSPAIGPQFDELFARFEVVAENVPLEDISVHKSFARRELHPLILCSPFVNRSYLKPLGYAGDYEMVNMMLLESEVKISNIYAKIVDTYYINASAPLAHRNRIDMLEERLAQEAERVIEDEERLFTVLNIGCGPASEVRRFIKNSRLSNHTSLKLMDFSDETLDFTRGKIQEAMNESGNKPTVEFVHKSIDQLLQEIQSEAQVSFGQYDMVYCAGLFDYFSDQICSRLVSMFYSWVRPGGLVSVTNVHDSNPNKNLMEHLLEWYLVYRDDNGMLKLAPRDIESELDHDNTGVNVFLDIRKPE
ncbi:class I SAM-dependent methyltransferase [Puniceicoccaceae bacterium K14]|nr:class I SAM-dependent methyltransferase [Puniceicoccaceae bacterium K14]